MTRKHGGNANIVPAWYGGSRDEICEILLNGFSPVMNLTVLVPFIWLLLIVLLMGKPHDF